MGIGVDIPLQRFNKTQSFIEWIAGFVLFAAAAAIVVWQNSHLAVLWDLSYIFENAHRIALGDVPYRDFPFPYAPLTFLIQAALIKCFGRVFWHTIVYCAIVNGMAVILAWRIMRNLLREATINYRLIAFLLSIPLIPLGVYSIFPHPFYDPDCTVGILISILCLQQLDRKQDSHMWPLLAGAMLAMPLFVKQNTGLAFLLSVSVLIVVLIVWQCWRRRSFRQLLLVLIGMIVTFTSALVIIQFTAGLKNYWHWTIEFAAKRRTPARSEMLSIYFQRPLLIWFVLIAFASALLWFSRRRNGVLTGVAALMFAVPFVWPVIYLLRDSDASERAERLVNLWPIVILISLIVACVRVRKSHGISVILPFVLIAAIHGAFMSQQLWGSTYAIWPLFMILVAMSLAEVEPFLKGSSLIVPGITSIVVASLLVAGTFYLRSHERLSYANLDDGALNRATMAPLKGLTTRGDWIPSFEELVLYTDQKIPRDEGILFLPGEDLFYYATGRKPQLPVVLFDQTVNPYSPNEILDLCRERDIRWVIVKQDLQDEDDQVEKERDQFTEAIEREFKQIDELTNYDVYRRKDLVEDDDDDSDNNDQQSLDPSH